MAIPINIEELLWRQVIESARIEYKADWNPEGGTDKNLDTMIPFVRTDEVHQGADYRCTDII